MLTFEFFLDYKNNYLFKNKNDKEKHQRSPQTHVGLPERHPPIAVSYRRKIDIMFPLWIGS